MGERMRVHAKFKGLIITFPIPPPLNYAKLIIHDAQNPHA